MELKKFDFTDDKMAKIKLRNWKPADKPNWRGDFEVPVNKIVEIITGLVQQYKVLTVRQVHYLLVENPEAKHPNNISGYKRTSNILTNMRYAGLLDWDKIVDETRGIYKTTSYENIEEAEKNLLKKYRRDRWKDNDYYVEVWTEKRTLVSQFLEITDKYDIYLASGGGFSSTTYIYEAIGRLYQKVKDKKKIIILYFGDLDPSGDFMDEEIKKRFKDWGLNIKPDRICLNYEQIDEYHLKKKFNVSAKKGDKIYNKLEADSRAQRFYDKHGELFQIELEALDPNILNEMLKNSILKFVDKKQQREVKKIEKKEVEQAQKKLGIK